MVLNTHTMQCTQERAVWTRASLVDKSERCAVILPLISVTSIAPSHRNPHGAIFASYRAVRDVL